MPLTNFKVTINEPLDCDTSLKDRNLSFNFKTPDLDSISYIESNRRDYIIRSSVNNIIKISNLVSKDVDKLSHFINQSVDDFYYENKTIYTHDYTTSILSIDFDSLRQPYRRRKELQPSVLVLNSTLYRSSEQHTEKHFLMSMRHYHVAYLPLYNYIKFSHTKKYQWTLLYNKETKHLYSLSKGKVRYPTGYKLLSSNALNFLNSELFKSNSRIKQLKDSRTYTYENVDLEYFHCKFNRQISRELKTVISAPKNTEHLKKASRYIYKNDTKKASLEIFGTSDKRIVKYLKEQFNNVNSHKEVLNLFIHYLRSSNVDPNVIYDLLSSFKNSVSVILFLILKEEIDISSSKFKSKYKDIEIVLDDIRIAKNIFQCVDDSTRQLLKTFYTELNYQSVKNINKIIADNYFNSKSFHTLHYNILNHISNLFKDKRDSINFSNYEKLSSKFDQEVNDFSITLAKNPKELRTIGNNLNICVGSYSNAVAEGHMNILILRDKNKQDLCCLEVKDNSIVQAKLKRNNYLFTDNKLQDVVLEYSKKVKLKVNTSDIEFST